MPRNFKLTWQPDRDGQRPLAKKYKGQRYYFPGGEGKYDREAATEAALNAWDNLKVKIDRDAPRKHQEDYELAIDRWEQVLAWCSRHGEPQLAETAFRSWAPSARCSRNPSWSRCRHGNLEATFAVPTIDLGAGTILGNGPTPTEIARFKLAVPIDLSPGVRAPCRSDRRESKAHGQEVWHDRLEVESGRPPPRDESLHGHIQKYIKQKEGQADAGEVSVGRVYALKLQLGHFEDWLGKDTAVRDIDGEILADYHAHLLAGWRPRSGAARRPITT